MHDAHAIIEQNWTKQNPNSIPDHPCIEIYFSQNGQTITKNIKLISNCHIYLSIYNIIHMQIWSEHIKYRQTSMHVDLRYVIMAPNKSMMKQLSHEELLLADKTWTVSV